jgi:hypothetical protein
LRHLWIFSAHRVTTALRYFWFLIFAFRLHSHHFRCCAPLCAFCCSSFAFCNGCDLFVLSAPSLFKRAITDTIRTLDVLHWLFSFSFVLWFGSFSCLFTAVLPLHCTWFILYASASQNTCTSLHTTMAYLLSACATVSYLPSCTTTLLLLGEVPCLCTAGYLPTGAHLACCELCLLGILSSAHCALHRMNRSVLWVRVHSLSATPLPPFVPLLSSSTGGSYHLYLYYLFSTTTVALSFSADLFTTMATQHGCSFVLRAERRAYGASACYKWFCRRVSTWIGLHPIDAACVP